MLSTPSKGHTLETTGALQARNLVVAVAVSSLPRPLEPFKGVNRDARDDRVRGALRGAPETLKTMLLAVSRNHVEIDDQFFFDF